MPGSESEKFGERVFHYHKNVAQGEKKKTVSHFVEEGHYPATIYRILGRCEQRGNAKFSPRPGRPAVVTSPSKVRKVERLFSAHPTISVREAAKKLKMKKSNVSDIKVLKLGITAKIRKSAPKYIQNQENRAKTGLRKIYKETREKVLVIDDETYVIVDPSQQPGRKFVHAKDHNQLSFEDKFVGATKFPKKYLVWQAMDEFGNVSDPYIQEGCMNAETYLKECVTKRLIPFIKRNDLGNVLFWPDLASIHYANKVVEKLNMEKVDFVPKTANPPNVPQARGIEKFWAVCKSRYTQLPKQPTTLRSFKYQWGKISRNVGTEMGKAIMDHAAKFIREIGYKGIQRAMCDLSNKNIV